MSSQAFFKQLSQTINTLEAQAMTKQQLQALLLWYGQSDSTQEALDAILELPSQGKEEASENEVRSIEEYKLQKLLTETQQLDVESCYQTMVHLTPTDMAKFALIQEFGPEMQKKSFFYSLVQAIASRVSFQA